MQNENILENIIKNIIENKIRTLLEIINKHYSTRFKKEEIDNEIQYIIKHISLKSYSINIPKKSVPVTKQVYIPKKLTFKNRVNSSIQNTSTTPIIPNIPTIPTIPIIPTTLTIPTTSNIIKINKHKQIKDENKCCSRIWANDIIDRNTMKKITNIQESFKVIDFKDINVKEFHKKYIIGLQCNKLKYKDSKYCKLHTYHLIHGDYKEIPSNEICYHFMKDGNYL